MCVCERVRVRNKMREGKIDIVRECEKETELDRETDRGKTERERERERERKRGRERLWEMYRQGL